jgi:hypothetical protein
MNKLVPALKWIGSALCWIGAVISGILTASGFVSGSFVCSEGAATNCPPQTVQLFIGIGVTLLLAWLGTVLWQPKEESTLKPWEYRD